MNLHEFEEYGHKSYSELCDVIATLLERAIHKDGGYRLQQVQHRAKTVESLVARLEEQGEAASETIESLRKDLAGCRIVFYTNNDVNRFVGSGILGDLFEVDWDRSRVHHPRPDEQTTLALFQSLNYSVSLKPDRTALLEYAHLEGLWCEVQVQTILNHAWAEMAHDTVYKRPKMKGFGQRELEAIEQRLDDAMRNYLLPAGYMFQKVASDVDRLIAGKTLFDDGAVDAVLNAADNNERHDAAGRLRDYVLPYYDNIQAVYHDIFDTLKRAWVKADRTERKLHEAPFGSYPGFESHQVTSIIAQIFEHYRYLDPFEIFELIRDLYVETKSQKSLDQLIRLAGRLSAHTMHVWQEHGPAVQVQLIDALKREQDLRPIVAIATEILGKILEPDITGTTRNSSTINYHTGTVIYSEDLARVRSSAIELLEQLARGPIDEDVRRTVFSALLTATQSPRHQQANHQVTAMIITDSAKVIAILKMIAHDQTLEIRQYLEDRVLHIWRRYGSLPVALIEVPELVDAHQNFSSNVKEFRDTLNSDKEFTIFKTLVGYQSVFPHMWEGDRTDAERCDNIRSNRQDTLIRSIDRENWKIWKRRLVRIAQVDSNDGATFLPFVRFLEQLAACQPALALDLLRDRANLPKWTVSPIAGALWKSGAAEDTVAVFEAWTDGGKHLLEVAASLAAIKGACGQLVEKMAGKAVEQTDVQACKKLMQASAHNFAENESLWCDKVFFPCLNVLATLNNDDWIDGTWHTAQEDSLFARLSEEQCSTLLDAMVNRHSIDFRVANILKAVSKRHHKLVIEWFGKRIANSERESVNDFTPIPFAFHDLDKVLR